MTFTLSMQWSSLQFSGHPVFGVWTGSSQGSSFGISWHITAMQILCPAAHSKCWSMQCNHQSLDSSDDTSGSSHSLNSLSPRIPRQLGVFSLLVCYLIAEATWQTQASWPIKPEMGFERDFWTSHCFKGQNGRILVLRKAHALWTQDLSNWPSLPAEVLQSLGVQLRLSLNMASPVATSVDPICSKACFPFPSPIQSFLYSFCKAFWRCTLATCVLCFLHGEFQHLLRGRENPAFSVPGNILASCLLKFSCYS